MIDVLTRAWNEWIAILAAPVRGGVPTLIILSLVAAAIVAVLWYFWPLWLPSNWGMPRARERERRDGTVEPGRRRLRLRWRLRWRRRRRRTGEDEPELLPDDEVPDLPAEVLTLTADQLAAAGRYAEAVRERLRAIVRGLIERDVLPSSPGWTVMELARAGGLARPQMSGALNAAAGVFSEIWYGLRPATAEDDAAMRTYAAAVAAVAAEPAAAVAGRSA